MSMVAFIAMTMKVWPGGWTTRLPGVTGMSVCVTGRSVFVTGRSVFVTGWSVCVTGYGGYQYVWPADLRR